VGAAVATPEILARLAELLRDSTGEVRRAAADSWQQLMARRVRAFQQTKQRWSVRRRWSARTVAELSS
jgi:hypothetical protein